MNLHLFRRFQPQYKEASVFAMRFEQTEYRVVHREFALIG
jgi:hypothetical protein